MAKKKNITHECKLCVNKIIANGELHCSTRIKDRSKPLTPSSRVGSIVDCPFYLEVK